MVYELIQRMQEQYQGIEVHEVNLIDHPEVASTYGVITTPALAINGRLAFTGVPHEKKLKEHVEALLASS